MGDFVDRGFYSVETFLLLLALKVRCDIVPYIAGAGALNSCARFSVVCSLHIDRLTGSFALQVLQTGLKVPVGSSGAQSPMQLSF
jgi:hypothetical protein